MIQLTTISKYLDKMLELDKVPEDYSNNGLQVQGVDKISKVLFAVDACSAVFEKAVQIEAQMIFVHHGISWKNGFKYLTGRTAEILSILFKNNISLYAAHLPLDAHTSIGHNVLIAKSLGLKNTFSFANYCGINIGCAGIAKNNTTAPDAIIQKLEQSLNTNCNVYGIKKDITKIGIISGGSGSEGIEAAAAIGLDCLITGEVGHSSWHLINELGIMVISCGHYKSEIPGVKAVMNNIKEKFKLNCEFVDFPTGL
jgi:dinuclear metal center YbgI/SA1388 family protein